MFTQRKLTTTCCVAVLALGLVACGSSDDDTSMTDPTAMEPMDSTAAEQLANAQAAVADAQTMVAALAADSSPSDRAAAYAALAGAQSVLAEASGIPENEIALLRAKIARLQGDIDKAKLDAQAEADRIAAEMTAEATRIAALVAGTASAETKRKAIGAEAEQMADAGLGGSGDNPYIITINRDRDGTKITITDNANLADADPAKPQFAQAMDLGNGRTMHTRTMDADPDGNVVTEVVIVSTDIDAPTATAFAMVTGQMLNASADDDADTNEALTVTEANLALVMSAAFFAAGTDSGVTHDFNAVVMDVAGTPDRDAASVPGTYNGAMGTYTCSGGMDCTVSVDDEGMLTAISDGWIFTPAMGATSDVADADYLRYGFWLQKTADEDGAVTYNEVETFADSMGVLGAVTSAATNSVTGTATYEGGATGVYVHSEINSDGSPVATTAGHFKADASLTAHFSGGGVAADLHNTVTGTIDTFALSGEEENAWSVALKGVINNDGTVPDSGPDSGTANGGGAEGEFNATFHGSTAVYDHDMDAATDMINRQPSSVVGEFNADFSNGAVAGGFGARKQ